MKKSIFWRLAIVLAAVAAFFLIAAPAMAIWDWCMFDPELNINGHVVDVQVSIQSDGENKAFNGNMVLTVTVPSGTEARVVHCDKKIKVEFAEDSKLSLNEAGTPVVVSLQLKERGSYPVMVTSTEGGALLNEAKGFTDGVVSGKFLLAP